MTLTRGAQRAIIAAFCAILAGVYFIAWHAPSVGMLHEDADYLLAAKALPLSPQWLRLLPLLCTLAWLSITWKLLRRMGAKTGGAWLLVLITAASPTVVLLGTNLMPEPFFAVLMAESLLLLLDERALLAGICAGLATLIMPVGVTLIVACMLVFVVRRRLRSAALFTAASMLFAAPWLGWTLAHPAPGPALQPSEKLVVLGANAVSLFSGPVQLLSGIGGLYAVIATLVLVVWSLRRRRQLMPDLFVLFYSVMLLCRVGNPLRPLAPVFPLVLWILWRAFQTAKLQELIAAVGIIFALVPTVVDATRLPETLRAGQFPTSKRASDDWPQLGKLFAWIRANVPADAVLMADADSMFTLNTGRKTIRGFLPDTYRLYYAPANSLITPDQLGRQILENGVSYVALTPERDFPETAAYHRAVEALERGGMLEPVPVPGLTGDYRLLRTASFRLTR